MSYISRVAIAVPTTAADALIATAKSEGREDVINLLKRGSRRDNVKCAADVSWTILRFEADEYYESGVIEYIRDFFYDELNDEYDYVRVGESIADNYEHLYSGMDLLYVRAEIVENDF